MSSPARVPRRKKRRKTVRYSPSISMILLSIVLSVIVGAAAGVFFLGRHSAQQCRRPSSNSGRAVLHRMNISHAGVTNWGLSQVEIKPSFTILDVGCGGGQTIKTLSAMATDGKPVMRLVLRATYLSKAEHKKLLVDA